MGTSHARTADELSEGELSAAGFAEPARARRLLISLAGRGVTDDDVAELLPSLLEALADSPDPDRALSNFARWADALVNRSTHFRYLRSHPTGLRIFVSVGATSQFLADILAHDPEYFEILANPGVRSGAKPSDQVCREIRSLVDRIAQPELKLEAMRRYRQREILRIASRDILGLADMPTTAREFSNLADACVQACFELARDLVRLRDNADEGERGAHRLPHFAVIALGKLGGRELNYSSDIDVIFVCDTSDDDVAYAVETATRMAEMVVSHLARDTQNGHLFRVDVRLRPEGRFGALVRTMASYRSYYENWSETWERQAMLKARFVAGDAALGQAFLDMVVPFVFPHRPNPAMLNDIHANKRRIEQPHHRSATPSANVKTGLGGIRDVEFTVQLLQMLEGAHDPLVRSPNTLQAIARLRQARLLQADEARALTDGYVFLRNVEHRLQLLYDRQTQDLPATERDLTLLGRRLGYADAQGFLDRYKEVTHTVRALHERLFWGRASADAVSPDDAWSADLLALDTPHGAADLEERLAQCGFYEPAQAAVLVKTAIFGTAHGREAPDASASFRSFAPRLLGACARSPDPDSALFGINLLAEASPNRAEWYRALDESEDLLHRLVRLAAGSRTLVQSLARHPEWLDLLVSESIADRDAKPLQETLDELEHRLAAATKTKGGDQAVWNSLAVYVLRERLRIGARDLWGEASAATIATELTNLADAALDAMLGLSARAVASERGCAAELIQGNLAVIALGKLGGYELSFGSDYDVLFVCPDSVFAGASTGAQQSPIYELVTETAERMLASARSLRERGVPIVVDARLRPEGRFGPTVQSVTQYKSYYGARAEIWERQALIKARPVCGPTELRALFAEAAAAAAYEPVFGEHEADLVRAMKRRIEAERLRPAERTTDIKLGHGGLSDIEFLTQLLQLRVGGKHKEVRRHRTTDALNALAEVGALPQPDATRLSSSYRFLSRVRNRLTLLTGQTIDAYPRDRRRARAIAIGLGTVDTDERSAEDAFRSALESRMQATRRAYDRLFHGRTDQGAQHS